MKELVAQIRREVEKEESSKREVELVRAEAERRIAASDLKLSGLHKMLDDARALESPGARPAGTPKAAKPPKRAKATRRKPKRVTDNGDRNYKPTVSPEVMARVINLFRERGEISQKEINTVTSLNSGQITRVCIRLYRSDPPQIVPTRMEGRSQVWKWVGDEVAHDAYHPASEVLPIQAATLALGNGPGHS